MTTPPATLRLALLGDSIAWGQGAARSDDTIGPRLARQLRDRGVEPALRVLAVPGARSDALAAQVRRATTARVDVALVVIGANDLTHFVPPRYAADRLGEAIRALRAVGAAVVVAPAPDLSVLPQVPDRFRSLVRTGSALLRAAQADIALAAGARVADAEGAVSAEFARDPRLFSADRFHPSSEGYAVITDALTPAVLAAAAEVLASSD